MAIITISRQLGSLSDEIARTVANELSYDYIDKPEIVEALADHGLRVHEKFDQKGLSFWESFSHQKRKLLYLIKAVLSDFAKKGNVVIYGWGTQVLFDDLPGVLRVRITAPFEVRIKRLVLQKMYDERNAEKTIRKSDRDSAGYISSFFKANLEDKDLYDLIINTRTISVNTAVELIINTLGAHEFKVSFKETAEKLADLALTQKAQAVLLEIPGLRATNLSVEKGAANLSGAARSLAAIEACEKAVSNIKGITKVNNQLEVFDDLTD